MSGHEPRAVSGAFWRIVIVDALISAMVLVGWADNGFGPAGLVWALGGLRLLANAAYLWRLLAPLRRWQDARERSDAQLLAADDAMQQLWRRLSVVQISTWLAALLIPQLAAAIGEIPFPSLEASGILLLPLESALIAPGFGYVGFWGGFEFVPTE